MTCEVLRGHNMAIRLSKLDLVGLAALVCYGTSVLSFIPREISCAAGVALCFILTGVTVSAAILPHRVSAVARFAAIVGCSLATGMVGGLILNYFPPGLVQFSWVTYALVVTLIAYAVARVRGARFPLQWKRRVPLIPNRASAAKVLTAAVLVIAAVAISLHSWNREKPFTEVWILPYGPKHNPWHTRSAVVGIKSHELSTEDFRVVMDNGKQTTTSQVTLAPNEVWTKEMSVEGVKAGATVYRGNAADAPYRLVWIVTR
jgi:uncharacterized membrane protein